MRVLNDEEIGEEIVAFGEESRKIWESTKSRETKITLSFNLTSVYKRVANTQYQADLKAFVEWGNEGCPHDMVDGESISVKHECFECWQSLEQLVE